MLNQDQDQEWNISLAGCGFRSVYYLGALSCLLERAPQLVHGASKIGGASSGSLVAAALVVGIPIEEFCVDVLSTAREARKHTLGVFHPNFSLLRTAKEFLLQKLPEDAHIKASGRLCVSLTRMSDWENVLVTEFDSRDELIQVLVCSCFFPFYSGLIPPSYRGVCYMDGALSNNMPLFEHRNTITMAPFSGESDICPKEGTFNFFEATFGNVSIQVNTGNVHRVCTSFLPPKPEKLAEICHNGYLDALRFLRERDLLGSQRPQPSLEAESGRFRPVCCELLESKRTVMNGQNPHQRDHRWLDLKVIEHLPVGFKKVLCAACREDHISDSRWSQISEFLPVEMFLSLLMLLLLPFELLLSLIKRLMSSGCSLVWRRMMLNEDLCRTSWSQRGEAPHRTETEPSTSITPSNSNKSLHMDQIYLTSTSAAPFNLLSPNTPAHSRLTLKHRS